MNKPTNLQPGKDFFGMSLAYDLDGNIKNQVFSYADRVGKHEDPGFSVKQGPIFTNNYQYDGLKRITSHTIGSGGGTSNILDLSNSYDNNGNILSMRRVITGVNADDMTYSYVGNRVNAITDSYNGDKGENEEKFESFQPEGSDNYMYDLAGNITNDSYKGTGTISYNYLNLPVGMTGKAWEQWYSADGSKVKSKTADGNFDYIGPVVFNKGKIAFIGTEEGRVLPPGSIKQNFDYEGSSDVDTTNRFWRYEYNLKDQRAVAPLGNLRVTCRCAEKDELDQDDRFDGYKPLIVQQAHGACPERFVYLALCFLTQLVEGMHGV